MKKKAPVIDAVVDTLKGSLRESGLVSIASTDTEPPLVPAVLAGDLARVKALLSAGTDPNTANKKNQNKDNFLGEPPLVHAVRRGHSAITEVLLKAGANPNYKPLGRSLLTYAIWEGKIPCVELLLRYGAKPVGGHRGVPSPLEACIDRAASDVFSLLLQNGANVCAPDSSGGSLLTRALFAYKNAASVPAHLAKLPAMRGLARQASPLLVIIREILRHRPDVNASDRDGITALMPATAAAPLDVIKNLLKLGADLEAELVSKHKHAGLRPIHFAVMHDRLDVVKLLATAGANLKKPLPDGTDLVQFAKQHSATSVLEYLSRLKRN